MTPARRLGRVAATALLLIVPLLAAAAPAPLPALIDGGNGVVRRIGDAGEIELADGRQLVLVDIALPPPRTAGVLIDRARSVLATLAPAGSAITLRFAGAPQDRYGRVLAEGFVNGHWLQGELLQRGLARVEGRADERAGLTAMLAIEATARQARRGLWALRAFAVRRSDELSRRDTDAFQIVEGTATQAAKVGGAVYVNFGPDWHHAFTLRIAGPALRLCRAAGLDPLTLAGAALRVRGFVEGGRRPLMEITFPEQIERLAPPR